MPYVRRCGPADVKYSLAEDIREAPLPQLFAVRKQSVGAKGSAGVTSRGAEEGEEERERDRERENREQRERERGRERTYLGRGSAECFWTHYKS